MVDYSLIKNEKLRQLVMLSESINSLEDAALETIIERISALPEEGEKEMIKALEDEQGQIKAAKLAKGITPEIEMEQLEEKKLQVVAVTHDLDKTVRVEHEKVEVAETASAAEDLIKNL